LKRIEGSWQVIKVAKLAKIPVIIPDSRELGPESGLLWTASTASNSKLFIKEQLEYAKSPKLPARSRVSFQIRESLERA
jgi:hypothetical protein